MPTTTINLTGQALSKTDDTNVTLTLGGTPLTALLKATSLTLGWTGTLAATRGGTGLGALGTANQLLRVNALGTALEYFTPSYGSGTVTSISVATANGLAGTSDGNAATPTLTLSTSINSPVLAGNGTALIAATTTGSGSTVVLSTSPTFVTDISAPKIISSTASGGLLLCNNNGVTVASFGVGSAGSTNIALIGATAVTGTISGTSSLTLGTASTTVGSIVLQNATNANTLTIQSGVTSSSYSLTLPTAQGGANTYLKNDGAGTLSWATVASGISIGDTIGGSPVTGSVLMNIGTTLTQSINYRAQQATPFSTAFGFECHNSGSFSGVYNTAFGWQAGKATTTALGSTAIGAFALTAQTTASAVGYNTAVGYQALASITTGYNNTGIGRDAGWDQTNATECVFIGRRSGWSANGTYNVAVGNYSMLGAGGGSYVTSLGAGAANNGYSYAISLGAGALNSAANELMIGGDANATIGSAGLGVTTVCIGNGNTNTSAASVAIRTTAGSGTNNAGGAMTFLTRSTGNATPPNIIFQTGTTLGSGTTLQTAATRFTIGELRLTASVPVKMKNYTVATLPTGSVGDVAYVTDATAPTYLGALVGGGAVTCLVFYNGAAWVSC